MIVGTTVMLLANTGLGLLALIDYDQPYVFFFFSIIVRFFQGYGDTLVTCTALSLITTNWSEEKTKYISFMEASAGLGLMIGPPMGASLYGVLNFAWTFYFFSFLIGICLIMQIAFLPNKLNDSKVFNSLDKN